MKTNFTEAQLADPELRVAAEQVRACVHCGFCLATCPTYVELGNELDSPRGRILLMQEFLETGTATAAVVEHVDRCLSCLACQTTCPSGVDYMHLVDHARAALVDAPRPSGWLRSLLALVLPRPALFRLALMGAPLGRIVARWLPEALRPLVALAPTARVRSWRAAGTERPVPHPDRPQVALLVGCVQSVLDADVHDATVRVLTTLGARVVVVPTLGCCGAVVHHLGRHDATLQQVRANVQALIPHLPHLTAIVSTVSGCGTMLEDYGHLLRNDPLAEEAARISALACDVLEAVDEFGLPEDLTTDHPRRVAYHAACSLQHGQRVRGLPQRLLRRLGHTVVDPPEAHLCCGSAGTYNLLQPELATTLGARKAAALSSTEPELVAAGNVGCAIQIESRVGVPVRHPVQLVDEALHLRPSGPSRHSADS